MTNFKTVFLVVVILFSFSLNSQTITTTLDSEIRNISTLKIGFNRRSDKGNWWTDNSFKNLLVKMNPDVLRYPGGTQANYWDWRTGKFLDNTDKNWNNKEVLKIPDFIAHIPQKTEIVYVVNMARPTPSTAVLVTANEETLKSDATLQLKITDMIAAIDKFVAEGKEPFAVELGNEFYFGNEEAGIYHIQEKDGKYYAGWNTSSNSAYEFGNKREATVENAKFYLKHCKEVVKKIKEKYPSIKFAITTTKDEVAAKVRERWNTTIFNELENNANFTTLKSNIYAATQHHYLNSKYGVQTTISDDTTAKVAIAEGIKYPIDKVSDYNLVPNDYKIWYTEYGEVKEIAEETWASAVRYAALVYSWLSLGNKVDQLDWHYVTDNNVVKTGSPMKLAPVGIAAELVSKAFSNMTEMQKINFTNNTTTSAGIKSFYGYKLKNDKKETLFIINTNNIDYTSVNFSSLFTYNGQPKMIQYYSNSPYITGVFEGDSNIKSEITCGGYGLFCENQDMKISWLSQNKL